MQFAFQTETDASINTFKHNYCIISVNISALSCSSAVSPLSLSVARPDSTVIKCLLIGAFKDTASVCVLHNELCSHAEVTLTPTHTHTTSRSRES